MVDRITAIEAYRRPGKRVYWDENLTERIGHMRMDEDGNLKVERGRVWVEVGSQYLFFTEVSGISRRRLYKKP